MNNNEANTDYNQNFEKQFQQPINTQPIEQHNKQPQKKKPLLIIVAILIVVVLICFIATHFLNNSTNKEKNSTGEKEITNNSTNKNKKQHEQIDNFYKSIDTSKFDKTKFSGYLYTSSGEKKSVEQILNGRDGFKMVGGGFLLASSYSFLEDQSDSYNNTDNGKEENYPGDNLIKIMQYIGQPSNVCYRTYDGTGTNSGGSLLMIYKYDNYKLWFDLADYTEWPESYGYKTLNVNGINFSESTDPVDVSGWVSSGFKCK